MRYVAVMIIYWALGAVCEVYEIRTAWVALIFFAQGAATTLWIVIADNWRHEI